MLLLAKGGFEAFTAMLRAKALRAEHPDLTIPSFHIPVTISNNVPGTEYVVALLLGYYHFPFCVKAPLGSRQH